MKNSDATLAGKVTLFLHMGPGLNAALERSILAPQHPETDYWDQPGVTGETAFDDLVGSAVARIESLSRANASKIALVAHSFGGNIAAEIIRKRPDLIESLTLLNTGYDPVSGFHSLLAFLAKDRQTPPESKNAIEEFLKSHPTAAAADLWPMVGLIVQVPDFMRLYWAEERHFQEHKILSEKFPPLSFPTFQDVLNSFLRKSDFIPKRISWDGPVHLILGDRDPLISVDETTRYWRALFPNLTTEVRKNSGHFVHLEEVFRLGDLK